MKACYEPELTKAPALAGKIYVRFTVGPSGWVSAADLHSSTIGNVAVETCTVDVVLRWQFPKPCADRSFTVTYPFTLTPTGGDE